MIYIGIDNGVSGSIGVCCSLNNDMEWYKMPIKKHLKYTKKKAWLNRVDSPKLIELFRFITGPTKAILERPMVNPTMFMSSCSALRAFEATLIVLEQFKLPYEYIDSKEWQKAMLPAGLKGKELKEASRQVAQRLFPSLEFKGDGDGILISEYCRRRDK